MNIEDHSHNLSHKEMEKILKEALDFAGIGMYRYKFDGTIIFMDQGAMRILENETRYSEPNEIVGKKIEDMIIYTGPHFLLRDNLKKHGRVKNFIYHFKTLDGKEKWAIHDSYITQDKKTGEEVIQVIIRDITDHMLVHKTLQDSEERLKRLINNAPDIVMRWSVSNGLEYVSPVVEQITGYTADEMLANPGLAFQIARNENPELDKEYEKILLSGETTPSRELCYEHKDGHKIHLDSRVSAIKKENGEIVAFEGIIRDVTEKKKADDSIKKAKREAELYLDLMLHDITNFNQICIGNLDLSLRISQLDELHSKYINTARRQLMRSENLISKLRTLSMLKTEDKETVFLSEFDLDLTISSCIITVQHLYPDKGPRIFFESDGEKRAVGVSIIESALFNVIENAVKYSDDENPYIAIEVSASMEHENEYWELSIVDNGPGIRDDMKEGVFIRHLRNGKKKGMGLGLFLAKEIVEKSGGSIKVVNRVEGDYSKGSVFTIKLRRSHRQP